MICHHCGFSQSFDSVKPCCENPCLVPLGIGTQRIENKVKNLFPDKNILRVDSDNISSKSDLKDFIKKANNNEIDIRSDHNNNNITLGPGPGPNS